MFGNFICKNCNHILVFNFNNPNLIPRTCTNCKYEFKSYNYLIDFAHKISNVNVRLHDLEFHSLGKHIANDVYSPKLKELQAVYRKSTGDTKDLLKAILEINHLLIEQGTKNQNSRLLNTYSKKLAEIAKEILISNLD